MYIKRKSSLAPDYLMFKEVSKKEFLAVTENEVKIGAS